LQLEPHLPWEILHLVIELLKLPIEELFSFQAWLTKLPPHHIRMLIQLLQIESYTLLEIKRRITSSNVALNASAAAIPTTTNDAALPIITDPSSPPLLEPQDRGMVGKGKKRRADNDLQTELDLIGNGGFNMELEEPLMIYPVEAPPLSPSMHGLLSSPPTTSPISPLSPAYSLTTSGIRTGNAMTPTSPLSIPSPSNRVALTTSLLNELDVGPFPAQPQASRMSEGLVLLSQKKYTLSH